MSSHAPRRTRRRPADRIRDDRPTGDPIAATVIAASASPLPPAVAGQLLTAEQLAERWQVPKSHVYRLTREGAIPAVRLGRYRRYRLDQIERFEVARDSGGHG